MLKPILYIVILMMASALLCTAIKAVAPDKDAEPVRRQCQSCNGMQKSDIVLGVWHCHRCGKLHLASEGVIVDEPVPSP